MIGYLGYMHHSLLAGSELYESAELLDGYHSSLIELSLLIVGSYHLHHLYRLVHILLIGTADGYCAVIGDIDLHSGTGNDLIYGLSSLTYHISDLLGVNGYLYDLGSILAYLLPGLGDRRSHDLIHDVVPGLVALPYGLLHYRSCKSVDLDIHLDGRDALMGTCHLEVHITEEILQSLDIRQHDEVIIRVSGHKAAGYACHLLLYRHARSH